MLTGLTDEQVNERIAEGKVNADENPNTRTYKQIIRENTLTFFNFLNLVLLVLVLLVGSYKNAFSIFTPPNDLPSFIKHIAATLKPEYGL